MVNIDDKMISQIIAQLEPIMLSMMSQMKIPGLNLAVTSNTEILFSKSYGVMDLETKAVANLDTIYMIGSCSKTYTSLAVMQLVEQGKIDLNSPIAQYIPITLGSKEHPITVKHLLIHSSGLSDLGMARLLIDRVKGVSTNSIAYSTWDDFYKFTNGAQNELVDLPGKRFIYSNTGYTLLGKIIESVSGKTFEDYIQENIFNPIEMTRSCYRKDQLDDLSNISTLYFAEDHPSTPYHEPIIAACGGVISTMNDQIKYIQMMLNNGQYREKQILTAKSLSEMETLQIKNSMATELVGKGFGPEGYGYGWMVFPDYCGLKVLNHAGSTGNGSANLFYSHDLNIGIVGTANHEAGQTVLALVSFLLSAALTGKNPMEIFPSFVLGDIYNKLAGNYKGYQGIKQYQVQHRGGVLYLDEYDSEGHLMNNSRALFPIDDRVQPPFHFQIFNGPGARAVVEFSIDQQGHVHMFVERYFVHKV
ncbi:MAG: serine hydrolase domain-containing protein [Promethearchaeota archaeon]